MGWGRFVQPADFDLFKCGELPRAGCDLNVGACNRPLLVGRQIIKVQGYTRY